MRNEHKAQMIYTWISNVDHLWCAKSFSSPALNFLLLMQTLPLQEFSNQIRTANQRHRLGVPARKLAVLAFPPGSAT